MLQQPATEAVHGGTGVILVEILQVCGKGLPDGFRHPVEVPLAECQQEAAGGLVCRIGGLVATRLSSQSFVEFQTQYEVSRRNIPVGCECHELADGFGVPADSEWGP